MSNFPYLFCLGTPWQECCRKYTSNLCTFIASNKILLTQTHECGTWPHSLSIKVLHKTAIYVSVCNNGILDMGCTGPLLCHNHLLLYLWSSKGYSATSISMWCLSRHHMEFQAIVNIMYIRSIKTTKLWVLFSEGTLC